MGRKKKAASPRNVQGYFPAAVLALILVIVVSFRVRLLDIPLERDEGIYAYFGQLVLEGKVPYIDFYEMKFPGLYYAYALLVLVFGKTVVGLHLGAMVLNLATIVFLFLVGRRLFDDLAGLVTAAAYGILSLAPQVSGFTAQSEHIVSFLATASLLTLLKALPTGKRYLFVVSGILVCAAFLVKPNAVFLILAYGLVLCVYHLGHPPVQRKTMFVHGGLYSLGVFTLFGLTILVMTFSNALSEMFFWTVDYPRLYVSAISGDAAMERFLSQFSQITKNYLFLWLLSGGGLILATVSDIGTYKKLLLWIFFICSFLTVVPGFRFYGHYWIQFLPAVALLIGVAASRTGQLLSRVSGKWTAPLLAGGVFCLACCPVFAKEADYYLRPNATQILRSVYGMNPFPEAKVVGDFIKSRTTAGDQIAVIGSEPQVYFYADRRCPSKHAYFQYLLNNTEHHQQWQGEFIDDVEKAQPKYMVYFHHQISIQVFPGVDQRILGWFSDYTSRYYKAVGVADMLGRYRTSYIWGEEAERYRPQGPFRIVVFERRTTGG